MTPTEEVGRGDPPAPTRFVSDVRHCRTVTLPTVLGELLITGDGHLVTRVELPGRRAPTTRFAAVGTSGLAVVASQLEEYLAGERLEFDLDLSPSGTPFQLRVWR